MTKCPRKRGGKEVQRRLVWKRRVGVVKNLTVFQKAVLKEEHQEADQHGAGPRGTMPQGLVQLKD